MEYVCYPSIVMVFCLGQSSFLKENIPGRCHPSMGRICNVGVAVSGMCKVAKEL